MSDKKAFVFSSQDSSGEVDLYQFQETLMQGLLYYINQIFLIEKPDVKAIANQLEVSEPTLYRIRHCEVNDFKYLPKIIELAKILGIQGTMHFELQR